MDDSPDSDRGTGGESDSPPEVTAETAGPAVIEKSHVASSNSPEPEPAVSCSGDNNTAEQTDRPTEHIVRDRETVTSIAAMYDLTPSELAQTNKLGMSRLVFPGQVLRIPSPPPPQPPPPDPVADLEIVEYQFIKLRVRHITTGRGVVTGSVLFTPNAVIFDPDPSDPLVEELEPEAFQIIAPMEFVVNAAIFHDFFPIGSTGKTVGREHPPSEIFSRQETEKNKSLRRQETSDSSYSLCEEDRLEAETEQRQEPYYLRLTMGKPVNREVSRSTPTMAYGRQIMWPEYWFIVPSRQVNNLYNFLQCWFPEVYGSFDLEEIHEMGMELVTEPEPDIVEEEREDSVGSINTVHRNIIHKTMTLNSLDTDLFLPEMTASSALFSDDQRKLLYRHIPPRVQGQTWSLLFSTASQGFSLQSLYRACQAADSPVLLVVQDTDHAVFGACISQPPALSEKFTGTGESWLFTFFPSFKVYTWTGENNYIMRAGPDTFIVGSSEGRFGLWLDESFNQGRSQNVTTFDNKPLPGKEDFIVNNIECWAFV